MLSGPAFLPYRCHRCAMSLTYLEKVISVLQIRFVAAPVQDAFTCYVIEADSHEAEVDQHLPEAEEPGAGDVRELAVDDGPGHHEDHFHVEEDKQNRDQVEAYAEAALRVADGLNAALVCVELHLGVAMATDKPRGRNHSRSKENRGKNLHQQWEILPEIRGW